MKHFVLQILMETIHAQKYRKVLDADEWTRGFQQPGFLNIPKRFSFFSLSSVVAYSLRKKIEDY
jgi:hypothetical protein